MKSNGYRTFLQPFMASLAADASCFRYDRAHDSTGACMKTIGSRRQPEITLHASGEALAAAARFSESIAHLAKSTFIPKGVYRFKSHEAANKHQQDCLARGMGLLAAARSRDRTGQSPSDT